MYKHILIPTDGSRLSGKAVRAGIDLARAVKAQVTLFTASVPYRALRIEGTVAPGCLAQDYRRAAERNARERLKPGEEYARKHGVTLRTEHAFSESPHEAIVDVARRDGCDLVCMASHGRRGLERLLLGSQTQQVLTRSKVPVLVCR